MQVGCGRKPRHEGDVLDRVPSPVTAPSEDVVSPPHAEDEAGGLKAPCDEREASCVGDPGGIWAAGEECRSCEAERDGKGRKAGEHDRRMDQHPSVAEHRIEPEAVGLN